MTIKSGISADFIEILRKQGFKGDCYLDEATRLLNATDNSVYQIMPLAVIAPKSKADIVCVMKLLNQPEFSELAITARGGGTGTNGQALNRSLILDCSKYLNNIIEINVDQGYVRVQPGVVLDQLNAALKPHGVFFAPTVSPSNRATLGGMANTDACGMGSRLYGKTSQHVISINAIYSDGSEHCSESIAIEQLSELKQLPGSIGDAYTQVDDTVCRCQQQVTQQFPKLSRYMTGYDLNHVYSDNRQQFNLNSILCGAEGTLVIIEELKLKLTPLPKHKRLAILQYKTFNQALSHAKELLSINPCAIETIDGTILNLAKSDVIYEQVKPYVENDQHSTAAINYVQWVGDNESTINETQQALLTLVNHPDSPCTHHQLARDAKDTAALWDLRKKSVGLLGKTKGVRKPLSGVEDTVVAPEKLADFIKDFRALLDKNGLKYGMFGHIDAGCLHVRPAYNLCDDNDKHLYFHITEEVAKLVKQYGGLLWGEHGKGIRSHYVPMYFGTELYQELRKIKHAFDPHNRLNPGKIATPNNSQDTLLDIQSPLRADNDQAITPSDATQFESSLSCNGNGNCFDYNTDSTMCPSYKVSRDRRYSPKGRASLIRQWLYRKSKNQNDTKFEQQVYQSMDHCLGCKACATGCPVNINIPNEKSKFLQQYHQSHPYTKRDKLIVNAESIAHKQSQHAWLYNRIGKSRLFNWFMKHTIGLQDLPVIATPNLAQHCKAEDITIYKAEALLQRNPQPNDVIVLQDSLTSCFEPKTVTNTITLLKRLGFNPCLLESWDSGKALHAKGMRDAFKQRAQENAVILTQLTHAGYQLIGLDPSITLSYQDEYPDVLGPVEFNVHLIQDWLMKQTLPAVSIQQDKPITLLMHCTESSNNPKHGIAWQQLFAHFGLSLTIEQIGCCGMAGSYGLSREHARDSKKLFEMSWQQHMKEDHIVLATGFSCRSQIKRFSEMKAMHPIDWLVSK